MCSLLFMNIKYEQLHIASFDNNVVSKHCLNVKFGALGQLAAEM